MGDTLLNYIALRYMPVFRLETEGDCFFYLLLSDSTHPVGTIPFWLVLPPILFRFIPHDRS